MVKRFWRHFITDKGHHYMVDADGNAMMFNGDTEDAMYQLPIYFLPIVVIACLIQHAPAQQTNQIIDGRKVSKPWADIVGREVVVEGLAWGATEAGLGNRVVLAHDTVYLRSIDLLNSRANGRLVRVTGTLRIGRVAQARPGAAGFSQAFEYFYIDVDKCEIVEQVSSPWMEEVLSSQQ